MSSLFARFLTSVFLIAMVTACTAPRTPQEAAEAFWESVVADDAHGVVRYSTLEDAGEYDGFGQEWKGLKPSWKKIVIEGDKAEIVTEFVAPGTPEDERREVVTYLVRKDGQWTVDYARTAEGMHGGVFSTLMGELGRIGQQLSEQFSASSEVIRGDMQREMESMRARMQTLSESLGRRANERIERYGETLREQIDELAESVKEAREENEGRLSKEDKRVLDEVAGDMQTQSDALSDPDADRVAEGSESAAEAQQKLLTIDEKSLEKYKEQWEAWREGFEAQARQFLDELNAQLARQKEKEHNNDEH
jgi:hypothetical protein